MVRVLCPAISQCYLHVSMSACVDRASVDESPCKLIRIPEQRKDLDAIRAPCLNKSPLSQ